jgi:hypothetical protein
VVVPSASPLKSLNDLVTAFRAAPESISWAGGSAGGTDQIVAWLIAEAVGVDPRRVNYVAYSGGGEALPAILGGQVTVGVNGLEGVAGHIDAGSVRVLGISSASRIPGLDAPTFIEQGVNVEIENWRSVVAPPGVSAAERRQLERVIEAMVRSDPWRATLARLRWNDRYLSSTEFARFTVSEEARIEGLLARLGAGRSETASSMAGVGRYPTFVVGGLLMTALFSVRGFVRDWRSQASAEPPADIYSGGWRALIVVAAAALIDLVLLDSAGFVLASSALFWLTARAFDRAHPVRDAAAGVALSVASYVVFARLLQVSLPSGLLAGVL